MVRHDVWSTDEELREQAKHPKQDPGSYVLSSDGWAWVIISVLCIVVAALFIAVHDLGNQVNVLKQTAITCQEDMPWWDCATMGNKICGPTK